MLIKNGLIKIKSFLKNCIYWHIICNVIPRIVNDKQRLTKNMNKKHK